MTGLTTSVINLEPVLNGYHGHSNDVAKRNSIKTQNYLIDSDMNPAFRDAMYNHTDECSNWMVQSHFGYQDVYCLFQGL